MKKRTFTVALIVCLVAIIGFGSLAYFQASKNITNYFAVAGVDDPTDPEATIDPDTLFSIKLDEIDITGENNARTETGNTYTGILPGDTLEKDPTVTNTGKYDAWVRVKVTVTDAAAWQAACEKHEITDLEDIFIGFDATKWDRELAEDKADTALDTLTYTYYYKAKVSANGTAKLFDSVTIPASFDIKDMASLATFQLKITGEAIQADNTGDTAQEAFENFLYNP